VSIYRSPIGKFSKAGLLISAFCLLSVASTRAQSPEDREEIMGVLEAQAEAWNRGDLDAFMETYWKSEELTYYSGAIPRQGWQEALERYRNTYQSEGSEMGSLSFGRESLVFLGKGFALLKGRWSLDRAALPDLEGLFTLVLKEMPDGWKIIHDHSSK